MSPVSQKLEDSLRKKGREFIAGVDEAGRGPLAGPVVAAAVILPKKPAIKGIDDSKKLSPKKREDLYIKIKKQAIAVGIGIVSEKYIDQYNIANATYKAMLEALDGLEIEPNHVLIDGGKAPPKIKHSHSTIIGGDGKCYCIAAASIIAKVTRDRIMVELDKQFPDYGFSKHKGYGTVLHKRMLRKHGRSPVHRKTFSF